LDEIHSLPEFLCTLEITDPVIPDEYRDLAEVFSKAKSEELPPHRGSLDHAIPLEKDSKPVFGPIYNLSETELQVLKEYIDTNLRKRFIRPSTSPFGSPVLFVKKPDGSLRLCVDYRALNNITIKNRYPLPLISEMLDRFKGAKYFTKLDVREAFNRLRIKHGDEFKTAFHTRYGHFEYLVMPFGLCNAPGSFQAYINDVIREFLDKFAVAYLDDILIYSDSLEEHILHVRQVLKKLLEHGLFVKLEKCEFHVQKISFLGFVISPEGISMDPARISTISDWPVPHSFLDFKFFWDSPISIVVLLMATLVWSCQLLPSFGPRAPPSNGLPLCKKPLIVSKSFSPLCLSYVISIQTYLSRSTLIPRVSPSQESFPNLTMAFSILSRIGLASAHLQNVTTISMTAKCLPLSNV